MKYKVLIHVENVDDGDGEEKNVAGPVELAACHTLPEALAIVEQISTIVNLMGG